MLWGLVDFMIDSLIELWACTYVYYPGGTEELTTIFRSPPTRVIPQFAITTAAMAADALLLSNFTYLYHYKNSLKLLDYPAQPLTIRMTRIQRYVIGITKLKHYYRPLRLHKIIT